MLEIPSPSSTSIQDPIHQGIEQVTERMHPYRPMPNLETGELKIDPEIQLKAKKFDLAISLFYSTANPNLTEYGVGRSASVRSSITAPGSVATVSRGDFSEQYFSVAGTSGTVTTYVSSSNTGNVTTLSYDSSPDEYTEYFTTGMQIKYKQHTSVSKYEIDRVVDADGVTQTYTYGTSGETGLLKTITVPGGNKLTYTYMTKVIGMAEVTVTLVSAIEDWGNRRWTMTYDNDAYLTQVQTPLGCQTKYTYALAGATTTMVQTIEDPRGYKTTYAYNSGGKVVSMAAGSAVWTYTYNTSQTVETQPTGALVTYNYDGNGNNTTIDRAEGYRSTLTYNANRLKNSETRPSGSVMSVVYNDQSLPVVSIDPLGSRTTYAYDAFNNLTTLTNALGNITTYGYDSGGRTHRLVRMTDALGYVTTYTYDSDGQTRSQITPLGFATTYNWDSVGNVVSVQYADGGVVTNAYDVLGRNIVTTNQLGNTTTFTYDAGDHILTAKDPLGNVTSYIYDTCLVQAIVDARGNRTSYTYGRFNNRITATDPLGFVTTYGYDSMGYPETVTDALGRVSTTVYNASHQRIGIIDAAGNRTTYSYDSSGRPETVKDAKGNVSTTVYNARDAIAHINAFGNRTTMSFDNVGQIVTVMDALQRISTNTYDAAGQQTVNVSPLGHCFTTVYDGAGQTSALVEPTGSRTTFTYDSVGRRWTTKNALGFVTTNVFDLLNRVAVTDPLSHITTFQYDAANRVVAQVDASSNRTTYTYDAVGNQTRIQSADSGVITMAYTVRNEMVSICDQAGRITTYLYGSTGTQSARQFANADITTYTYDVLDRLVSSVYADATRVTMQYDALSNRTTLMDSTGTTAYAYDALSRVTTVGYAGPFTLVYAYDAVGKRTNITDPSGGITTYHFNDDGVIDRWQDTSARTTTNTFDSAGRVTTITRASGYITTIAYDDLNQVTSLFDRNVAGFGYQKLTMTYDGVGNPTKIKDGTSVFTTYTYDSNNRITNANLSAPTAGNFTYTYDAVGNKTFSGETSATTYTYDLAGQIVTSVSGGNTTTYTFDSNGNMTRIQLLTSVTTMTYDKENRMTVYNQDGTRTTYSYDGDGYKRSENVVGTVTTLLWDGSTYFGEVTGGSYTKRYYSAKGRLTAFEAGGTRNDYVNDHLGSVTAELDQSLNKTYDARYLPYGKTMWLTGAAGSAYAWVGTHGYRTTGLQRASHYMIARHYANQTQVWLTRDRLWPDEDAYVYANGNVIRLIDPRGNRPITQTDANNAISKACGIVSGLLAKDGTSQDVYGDINDCIKSCTNKCPSITRKNLICLQTYTCTNFTLQFQKGDCCGSSPPCAYTVTSKGGGQGSCIKGPTGINIYICAYDPNGNCNPLGLPIPVTTSVIHEVLHCCGLGHGPESEPNTCNTISACCILKASGSIPPNTKCCKR